MSNEYVSIVATHQARMRCIVNKLISGKIQRFQNAAVIKLTVKNAENNKQKISCKLVYNGELNESKPEREYYVNDNNITSDNYTPLLFPEMTDKIYDTIFNDLTDGVTYVFYLIRHGQAGHNILKGLKKKKQAVIGKKDTCLTGHGKQQAVNVGNALINELANIDLNSVHLFIMLENNR